MAREGADAGRWPALREIRSSNSVSGKRPDRLHKISDAAATPLFEGRARLPAHRCGSRQGFDLLTQLQAMLPGMFARRALPAGSQAQCGRCCPCTSRGAFASELCDHQFKNSTARANKSEGSEAPERRNRTIVRRANKCAQRAPLVCVRGGGAPQNALLAGYVCPKPRSFPDTVQRASGAPQSRDLHKRGACDDPGSAAQHLRAALRPGNVNTADCRRSGEPASVSHFRARKRGQFWAATIRILAALFCTILIPT